MPCIWHHGAAVPFGPQTLRRYFDTLIADWIAQTNRTDLRQDFDALVESYVAETLHRRQIAFTSEKDIKKLVKSGEVIDFLIEESDSVVLLEVKNKVLSQAVPASRDPLELASRLKATVVKAQSQLAATEASLKLLSKYKNRKFYRLIVTSNDLWLSSAELLSDQETNNSKTWLLSLRELDMLTEIVVTKPLSIGAFFLSFEENQKNSLTATFSIEAYLERMCIKPERLSSHIRKVVENLFDKIQARLDQPPLERFNS